MQLLFEPRAWLSFLTLALLEIVLGFDNIIFLVILVDRLPPERRKSARLMGLSFAMLTRIGLLFTVVWLASPRAPWFALLGKPVTARALVLFAGGAFLVVKSVLEIREMLRGVTAHHKPGTMHGYWAIVAQIGIIDIAFSLDTVFTAVGLANRVEIMVAAIVAAVLVMMVVSGAIGAFIERQPTIKVLALAFLALVGGELIAESLDLEIPKGYLYFAMAFAGVVEWLSILVRRRGAAT